MTGKYHSFLFEWSHFWVSSRYASWGLFIWRKVGPDRMVILPAQGALSEPTFCMFLYKMQQRVYCAMRNKANFSSKIFISEVKLKWVIPEKIRRMAGWKFSRERGSKALEILAGGGFGPKNSSSGVIFTLIF